MSAKVLTRHDVGRAASYYEDSADDYYAKEGDASAWQGAGAELLELAGEVDPARFRQLLAGIVSADERVSRGSTRDDSHERIGIDLTFSAPKSVSVQALIGGDARVIQAHDRAVTVAIEAAEKKALARRNEDGRTVAEATGNLVVAKFRHETSRERDPQLHTHAVVMNLTRRADGQWRALKNDEIVGSVKLLGAVYRAELAVELQKAGYALRHERDGMFELAHITPRQLDEFSRRSKQIEERLAERGTNREEARPAQKQMAALQTRPHKRAIDREAVFADWQARARELGIDFGKRERQETPYLGNVAEHAVRYAVAHLTERQSIIGEHELIDTAMKHGVGVVRMRDIETEIAKQCKSGFLIRERNLFDKEGRPVERRYTTETARTRERHILKMEHEGRGKMTPTAREVTGKAMEALNAGQREAVGLIATADSRIVGVQGFAGTGKSHMLKAATGVIKGHGFDVLTLAPYGSQVKALRELGVESRTVASFLRAKEKDIGPRTVLIVDEAGVLPTRLMEQTLQLAEKAGARVVLMGDTAQTKAIEAGRPFDQLQAAGMGTAHMTEILRQRYSPELKAAVQHAAHGRTAPSLARIGHIAEIKDDQTRRAALVADYVALPQAEREQTLIVSGTNEARRAINEGVRAATGLTGKGIEYTTLARRDSTQAERRFSKNYARGDVIQPETDYANGLKRGETYTVVDTGPGNKLTVTAKDGHQIMFSPAQATKLSVYQPERNELAPGDAVRITRNDAALDVANGDRFKVAAVEAGRVVLEGGGRRIELNADKPLHLDYAHATTVHSAQGLTCERVLIDAQTNSRTTARDVYYVAISRAKTEARIYTDDRDKLPRAIARENVKHAALDLKR